MKNKLIYLSLLLIGCSKDYIKEEVYLISATPSIEVRTTSPSIIIPEVSSIDIISERYSSVNETTGYFKSQEYFTEYLSKQFIESHLSISYDGHTNFKTFQRNSAITDIDGDGKQDIIAFANSFCNEHTYSYHHGKIIYISDYKNSFFKQVFDVEVYFGSGKLEVNDFNSDGISDVILSSHDTKMNSYHSNEDVGGSTNNSPVHPHLITFENGLKITKVGIASDVHSFTSGDIDNDGDIDFIQWPIPGSYNNETTYFPPSVALNDGNGNFTNQNLVLGLSDRWYATSVELFDVNGDNNLDLLLGWRVGSQKYETWEGDLTGTFNSPVILFGNGSGFLSLDNKLVLEESFLSSRDITAATLGFGFTDFNNDGDVDIIVTNTREEPDGTFEDGTYYDNYYLLFFENINNSFAESTFLIQDSFNQSLTFPNFYYIKTIDIDNDGDFDIIPDGIANWGPINYLSNLHWKNTGNNYEKSW